MAGGSREPEAPTDMQCENCGLYFSSKGIHSHRDSCDHPEWAKPLVELENGGGANPSQGSGATPESPEPKGSDPQEAKTDGGGLGLSGPPETTGADADGDPDDDPEPETVNCASCGTDLEASEEELRERFGSDPFQCGDCGARLTVKA